MPEVNNQNEEKAKDFVEKTEKPAENIVVGTPLTPVTGVRLPWQVSQEKRDLQNEIGWEKLKITDLPTQGLFYPDGD